MSLAVETPQLNSTNRLKSLRDLPLRAHVHLQTELLSRSEEDRDRRRKDIAVDLTLAALAFYLMGKGMQSPLQRSVPKH